MVTQPTFTVDINADDIIRQLRAIGDTANKALSRGLNDSAFGLRQFWISDINTFIHNATAFTRKVFVKKSDPNNLIALTFLPSIQSEYLNKVIEGGVRRPGDYATLNGEILVPVGARLNKAGNFPLGPKRWLASLEERIKGAFVGVPGDEEGKQGAVYQRLRNGRLKLLAVFEQAIEYDDQLPLEKTTETYASQAEREMQKNLDRLLRT